jgi:putative flippase GtrA
VSSSLDRLRRIFPSGQFPRYLCVGVFNTILAYSTFALILFLLNHLVPQRYLYLSVLLASILALPLNITVAYFGYKVFVFRTQGNYLREWLKCFAVYGVGAIPGLFLLSALTKLLQSVLHRPQAAGYLAGAIVTGCTTLYGFLGHRNITFSQKPQQPDID